jgi:hypothetical protein
MGENKLIGEKHHNISNSTPLKIMFDNHNNTGKSTSTTIDAADNNNNNNNDWLAFRERLIIACQKYPDVKVSSKDDNGPPILSSRAVLHALFPTLDVGILLSHQAVNEDLIETIDIGQSQFEDLAKYFTNDSSTLSTTTAEGGSTNTITTTTSTSTGGNKNKNKKKNKNKNKNKHD